MVFIPTLYSNEEDVVIGAQKERVVVRHIDDPDVEKVKCDCGWSIRMLTEKDGTKIRIHHTTISEAKPHRHKVIEFNSHHWHTKSAFLRMQFSVVIIYSVTLNYA